MMSRCKQLIARGSDPSLEKKEGGQSVLAGARIRMNRGFEMCEPTTKTPQGYIRGTSGVHLLCGSYQKPICPNEQKLGSHLGLSTPKRAFATIDT